jgi:AP-2 complex subunit alpha
LVKFIADLRNARARELEEKRINKELANIRLVITYLELDALIY